MGRVWICIGNAIIIKVCIISYKVSGAVLVKLFEPEIKFMLKLNLGQILTKSGGCQSQNLTHPDFEHAFKPHTVKSCTLCSIND